MIGAGGRGKFGKEAREIRVRLDAIGSGGFDQRVHALPFHSGGEIQHPAYGGERCVQSLVAALIVIREVEIARLIAAFICAYNAHIGGEI